MTVRRQVSGKALALPLKVNGIGREPPAALCGRKQSLFSEVERTPTSLAPCQLVWRERKSGIDDGGESGACDSRVTDSFDWGERDRTEVMRPAGNAWDQAGFGHAVSLG
jgi:hypothetical protein